MYSLYFGRAAKLSLRIVFYFYFYLYLYFPPFFWLCFLPFLLLAVS